MRYIRVTLVLLLVLQQPVAPAVIVVDGSCTLNDAIDSANSDSAVGACAAGSAADEIQLTSDVVLTSPLSVINTDVLIEGNGHTISRDPGAGDFGLLHLQFANLVLRNSTLTGGSALTGAAIRVGYNASLKVYDSLLTDNVADFGGGAILVYTSLARIENSTLSYNSASTGAGLRATDYADVTIINSTLRGNSASSKGGGLYAGWDAVISVYGSSIVANSSSLGGGVIASDESNVRLLNTTISGNTATNSGGGVYSESYATVRLLNSTVIGNGEDNLYFGFTQGDIELYESIVALPTEGDNCEGTGFLSGSGNFDDDGTCPDAAPIVAGVDLDLTIADNGGPTETHALLAGSVAADASPCGPATDQRGFSRSDGLCDAGSFELGAEAPGVGGRVFEMSARRARCVNLTTSQSISFNPPGGGTIDCETNGLSVEPGDTVRVSVLGLADTGAAGASIGLDTTAVRCRNVTTGQAVPVPSPSSSWDCVTDGGLTITIDDRVEQVFEGDLP